MTAAILSAPDQARIRTWQIWIIIFAVICEIFLAADWYAFAADMPFLSKEFGLDPAQAGMAQGIFAVAYGVAMLLWSPVSRHMSARALLLIGLAGTGIGMVLQLYMQNYAQLIALRLFIGFFDAAVWTGNIKLIVGWFPKSRRGSMMGLILAAYSLAITLDFALGIPLTIAHGWRVFFGVLACGTLLVAAVDLFLARSGPAALGISGFSWEGEATAQEASVPFSAIFRSRWILVGGLSIAGCTFALSGTATWVIPAYITVDKMPVQSAALVGTLMGLSQVLFLIIGGIISDRRAKTAMIKFTIALACASALTFVVALSQPVSFPVLLVPACLSGIAVVGGGAIFSLLAVKYHDDLAPAAIGYAELAGVIGTFIAPALLGFVVKSTGSFKDAFLVFALVEAAIFLILLVLAREGRMASASAVETGTA